MPRVLKALLAITFAGVAALAVVRGPIARQRCNVAKGNAQRVIERCRTIPSDAVRQPLAARAVPALRASCATSGADWESEYLLGTLQSLAGRRSEGIESYQAALVLQQRPEIYFSLSVVQMENGDPLNAMENARHAALFDIEFAEEYEPHFKNQLWNDFNDRQQRILARKR